MTTTDIETEIETEVETKVEVETPKEEKVDANLQELNEIAKSKQKLDFNVDEFKKVKSEYSTIEQNNTQHQTLDEIEENKTDKEVISSIKPILKSKPKQKTSSRLKIFVICASLVLMLSAGLLIYNGVQIAITKSQIALVEREIATGQASYSTALKQLKQLTNSNELTERAIDLNMGENNQTIKADIIETKLDSPQKEHTNWFNDLCNFLSNLFGN